METKGNWYGMSVLLVLDYPLHAYVHLKAEDVEDHSAFRTQAEPRSRLAVHELLANPQSGGCLAFQQLWRFACLMKPPRNPKSTDGSLNLNSLSVVRSLMKIAATAMTKVDIASSVMMACL